MYREMPNNSIDLKYESAYIDFSSVDYRGLDRDDNTATLYGLRSREKKKGHASKLMDYVCSIADMYNINLELGASSDRNFRYNPIVEDYYDMLTQDELVAFYKKKGFVFKEGSICAKRKPDPKPIDCDESIIRFFNLLEEYYLELEEEFA